MMLHKKNPWVERRGQTLIEALLALSVITVSFMGITTLFARSFFYDRVTSDELTATYLASEGIELAKSFIDYGTYSATPYGTAWGDCLPPGQYELDYTMTKCNDRNDYVVSAPAQPLYFHNADGSYGYQSAGGTLSNFSRIIQVTYSPAGKTADDEVIVDSIVTWSTGPISQSVKLEDHFYNWRQ